VSTWYGREEGGWEGGGSHPKVEQAARTRLVAQGGHDGDLRVEVSERRRVVQPSR